MSALLEQIEREVAAAPERCFSFDAKGEAMLTAAGCSYAAGAFTMPTLGDDLTGATCETIATDVTQARPPGAG